jgi:hypothetical protein
VSFKEDWTIGEKNKPAATKKVKIRVFKNDLRPAKLYTISGLIKIKDINAVLPGAPANSARLAEKSSTRCVQQPVFCLLSLAEIKDRGLSEYQQHVMGFINVV